MERMNTSSVKNIAKQRISWIDCAKGIAILLVVFGHSVGSASRLEAVLRGVIFSFHIPLFFILSCITFRFSNDSMEFLKKTEKAFRHLIIPVFMLYGIHVFYGFVVNGVQNNLLLSMGGGINRLIYASGVPVKIEHSKIPALGITWFLVALFLSRTIFDYFYLKFGDSKKLIFVTVVFSIVGVILGKIQWLPFNLDIAFSIMPFMWIGNFIKKIDIKEKTILGFLISTLVFCVLLVVEFLICNTYLEIAWRRYPIFPISFAIAVAGTFAVSYFSQILEKIKIFKWLDFLGRNSFLIFAVHSVDYFYEPAWKLTENNITNGFIRCIEDVVFMIVIYFFKKIISEQRKKYLEHKNLILELGE